jgi:hypothetical protein
MKSDVLQKIGYVQYLSQPGNLKQILGIADKLRISNKEVPEEMLKELATSSSNLMNLFSEVAEFESQLFDDKIKPVKVLDCDKSYKIDRSESKVLWALEDYLVGFTQELLTRYGEACLVNHKLQKPSRRNTPEAKRSKIHVEDLSQLL